ncbi:MAG: hypothetical protein AMJ79_00585 [Phycisphaerae bacterium SM23_30]|nr:MAG: hypothetical protein AMJ79_00585 [Phycisphaerae bacterium SM23_30]
MTPLNSHIESHLIKNGAASVGFADLTNLSPEIRQSMSSAVSIAVALDASIVNEINDGPTRRYYQEYRRANDFLADLSRQTAEMIQGRGFAARALATTVEDLDYNTLATEFAHKTAATRAGLGWIGKSALLITEKYGAALRLATVLTDAELPAGTPVTQSRCDDCRECVVHCPARAISGTNWQAGMPRETFYDAFACCETAQKLSEKAHIPSIICGICINVCPWTQKYLNRKITAREDSI